MNKTKNAVPTLICSTLMLILLITPFVLTIAHVYSAGTTTVHVNPTNTNSSPGQSFTLNMTITSTTNLNAWQLHLLFNPEILNCTGVWVPPDNIFAPYGIDVLMTMFNNTAGYIRAFCALNGTFGVNTSGTLCQIGFTCKNPGITTLSIAYKMQAPMGSYLQDPNYNLIPFDSIDGVIEVSDPSFQKNVFNVTQNSITYQIIILSNSTVTSFNYYDNLKTMSYDASGLDGTTGLSSVTVSKELLNGTFAVLVNNRAIYYTSFENQTHNFLSFIYTHSTKHIKILLTIIGDINGDRSVDMLDISIVIDAFMTSPGDAKWNPLADMNKDGLIDMLDISVETDSFLKTWNP